MTIWPDMIVRLEPWELELAAYWAARRWADTTGNERQDRGNVEESIARQLVGTAGEIACAKWLQRYWSGGVDVWKGGDIGELQVRSRRGDHLDESLELILQPKDEQHHPRTPYILVVGRGADYRVVGWTTPWQARQRVLAGAPWVEDRGERGAPAMFVPQGALADPDVFRASTPAEAA